MQKGAPPTWLPLPQFLQIRPISFMDSIPYLRLRSVCQFLHAFISSAKVKLDNFFRWGTIRRAPLKKSLQRVPWRSSPFFLTRISNRGKSPETSPNESECNTPKVQPFGSRNHPSEAPFKALNFLLLVLGNIESPRHWAEACFSSRRSMVAVPARGPVSRVAVQAFLATVASPAIPRWTPGSNSRLSN
jgi:hypothetical protein